MIVSSITGLVGGDNQSVQGSPNPENAEGESSGDINEFENQKQMALHRQIVSKIL